MTDKDYFSHNSYNSEAFSDRFKTYGYTPLPGRYWTASGNFAYNDSTRTASADKVHSQGINSTGDKATPIPL